MMANTRPRAAGLWLALAFALIASTVPGGLFAADPANLPSRLDPLLDRTASVVEKSLQQLSDVASKENVSQIKFGKNGKPEYEEHSLFDYVVLFQPSSGEPVMVESRLAKEGPSKPRNISFLLTNGFSTMLLIFHPYYAGSFQFIDMGEVVVDGRTCVKVHFQHVKGLRSTTALLVSGREYPIDLQGTALINKASGEILKIEAGLEAPMDDVGLKSLQSEIIYSPISFPGVADAYLLPTTATIDVESLHQHWRNTHRFTNYHRFETSVKETIGSKP